LRNSEILDFGHSSVQRYAPGSTLEDALRELQPDILIIDSQMDIYISDEAGSSPYGEHLRLPRSELEAFLKRNGNLVGELEVKNYGPIRVYRITWEQYKLKD
jgi:hypothetical protein